MNIMELGAIGELVGGVAVVGSLIYLALQVRQSTVLLKRSNAWSPLPRSSCAKEFGPSSRNAAPHSAGAESPKGIPAAC